jgi:hypothetical protein
MVDTQLDSGDSTGESMGMTGRISQQTLEDTVKTPEQQSLTGQSGSTPRRLPRSDRPTLDPVSGSSSRMVTCMFSLRSSPSVYR